MTKQPLPVLSVPLVTNNPKDYLQLDWLGIVSVAEVPSHSAGASGS